MLGRQRICALNGNLPLILKITVIKTYRKFPSKEHCVSPVSMTLKYGQCRKVYNIGSLSH